MKRTVFRVTAAALAVVTPLAITTVASPIAFAQPAAAEAPAVAPAEVQLNTATPHQDLEKTKWRTIVANYQKAGYAVEEVSTYSPSMNRLIPVVLIRPVDPAKRDNAPTLYLLNGADGGEGRANWLAQTDVIEYYGGNEGRRDDQKKARGQMTSPALAPTSSSPWLVPTPTTPTGSRMFHSWKAWIRKATQQVRSRNGKPTSPRNYLRASSQPSRLMATARWPACP